MVKLLNQPAVGISFRRFILTVVISAALGTVIPLEQWNGGSHNAFQISSAFAQGAGGATLMVNGSSAPITVPPSVTITIKVVNPTGNALDWNGIYPVGATAGTTKNVVEHYVAGTAYSIPATTLAGAYEARLFANDSLTLLATSAPITVSTSGGCTSNCFYVSVSGDDSNPGTQAAPWRTISKASTTLQPGQTVVVMDGTYEEPGITFRRSGTASQPITLISQNKWKGVLSSMSGCSPAIGLYASYITIQDLSIVVSPNNPTCPTPTVNIPAAIRAWEQSLPTVSNPTTGYVGFTARGLYVGVGFALGIKTNQDFTLVENSEIHNSLEAFNDIGSIFRNNVTYGADVFGSTIFAKGGVRNIQIYNNVVHMTSSGWTEGLLLGGSSGGQWLFEPYSGIECYNCVAYNNVVINETGISRDVFVMAGCKDCTFLNNIGINGATSMRGGGGNKYPTTNPTWRNNILTIPTDPGLTADWHLAPGSGYQGAGIAMPTVPAYGGGTIDVSKNKDGVTRTTPWNLGIY